MFGVWAVPDKLLVLGWGRQKPFVCICLLLKSKDICSLSKSPGCTKFHSVETWCGVHKLAWNVLESLQSYRKGSEEQYQDRLCYRTFLTQCY